jgi:cytochrome P450
LLDGERHLRQRRLLMPPFHGARMRAYGALVREIAEQVMTQWAPGRPFLVRSATQEMTLRMMLRAVFGVDEGPRFQQLGQLLGSLFGSVGVPLRNILLLSRPLQRDLSRLSPWGRLARRTQRMDQLLSDEIRDRREQRSPPGADILSLLMSAQDEAGQPMTQQELLDELRTLLFAGQETTAAALAWALYWIHQLPEVYAQVLRELEKLGDGAEPSEITELPYLTAICHETLRIYPPAIGAHRILQSPLELMGYRFKSGTILVASIYLTHRREDLYPEPSRFRPERFLARRFSPYEFLPFGGGHRRCIGMAFALLEMKLLLATIMSRWQLALTDRRPLRPVRRVLTFAPPSSFRMIAIGQRRPSLRDAFG